MSESNRPSHRLLHAREYEVDGEKKSRYTEVGAAWTNSKGFTVEAQVPVTLIPGEKYLLLKEEPKGSNQEEADS